MTILEGKDGTPFYVEDSTGTVLVDPSDATIDIPADYTYQSGMFKTIPSNIQQFCKSKGVSSTGFLGSSRSLKFEEKVFEPGDPAFIIGTAGDNPHVEDSTGQKNSDDIMIQKGKGVPYYISDTTENKVLRKYAWIVYGGLFGGSALLIGGLFALFLQLGIL